MLYEERNIFSLVMAFCIASGSSMAQSMASKKILIVYLSRTNNTKAIAEIIQKNVGGKLVAIELATPYPADYHATVQQVVKENETGYLPPLKTKIDSIGSYDIVFVGFPTWDMKMPPPMKSFLKQYDLGGIERDDVLFVMKGEKKIIEFIVGHQFLDQIQCPFPDCLCA